MIKTKTTKVEDQTAAGGGAAASAVWWWEGGGGGGNRYDVLNFLLISLFVCCLLACMLAECMILRTRRRSPVRRFTLSHIRCRHSLIAVISGDC